MILAARRSFKIGDETIRTPLIVPSYSSRASGQDVSEILKVTKEFVGGPILISAYDVKRHKVKQAQTKFATHIFLDSGGYEAGADADLSEVAFHPNQVPKWTTKEHQEVVASWDFKQPTALVSYDSPDRRETLSKQIARARKQKEAIPAAAHILLVKPEPPNGSKKINVQNIVNNIQEISEFDVLGFTEKELGDSLFKRLLNVARIRSALTAIKKYNPIHVFGSLDPVACPLFFICGADIFDGLTWIRYAYHDAMAVYRQNVISRLPGLSSDIRDGELSALIHVQNYHTLGRIKDQMVQFLPEGRFDAFPEHGAYFTRVWQQLVSELGS